MKKAISPNQFSNPPFYLSGLLMVSPTAPQGAVRGLRRLVHKLLGKGSTALLLAILAGLPLHAGAALPAMLEAALGRAGIPADAVGLWVQGVDEPQPSLQHNAAQALNPASLMKLVTAFASLEHFGPAHQWHTQISSTGAAGAMLAGNLDIVGSGDPMLDHHHLARLFARLQARGLRHIEGDIVLDDSVLRLPAHDPAAFDGRGLRPYNSGPHGMLLNFNTLQLALYPGAPEGSVEAIIEPPLDGLKLSNRLRSSTGPCTLWYRDLDARLGPGGELILDGSLPSSCGPRTWSAAPLSAAGYAEALVGTLWRDSGGSLAGQVRHGKASSRAASVLAEHASPPLAEIVREMNKWSSNVIARQLLANLAAGSRPPGAEADMVVAGAARASALLAEAGIDTRGLVIENGAGLSRIARIRADSLGQLLLRAWQRPWMPEFISALPMAGVDGTARRHLGRSPARGQAHIKTGTINGVRGIAGYVLDRHGRRHAVVMMINHPRAHDGGPALDALLEWVWAGAPLQ